MLLRLHYPQVGVFLINLHTLVNLSLFSIFKKYYFKKNPIQF